MATGDVTRQGKTFVYETELGGTVRVSPFQKFEATPRRRIPGYGEWVEIEYRQLGNYDKSHNIRVVS
jgi:hypothetical protein